MKKVILAVLCVAVILLGSVMVSVSAETPADRYQVGYGIRDINPWVDPNDHSKGVLPVELHGNGNNWERVCTGFMDDNDDGVVGEGDGVFTTATAVTDPYGETMIYITIDSLQGYSNITADVRNALSTQLGIRKDHVMVNGNHTHSGANYSGFKNSSNPQFKAYYEYIVQQIVDASVEAYNDRAEAVMSRGSIDATDSTAYLGYNNGKGYHMNAIRHYDVVSQWKTSTAPMFDVYHVAGSNFGGMTTTMREYKQKSRTNALVSDNNMYVLLFEFPNDSTKEPVIFVNWRAHSTTNSGGANKTYVSGDYANSIRANMKKNGYRAAFFQGASGNVVTKSTVLNDWTAECYKEYGNYEANTNVYGRILTDIALDCVDRKMTQELPAGKIKTMQITFHGEKQEDSEGYVAAAQAYQDASAALGENQFVKVPYSYTHTDGKTYIINSKFHASNILTRHKTTTSSYTDIELNAIMMGENVAFVTIPNEIADRMDLNGSLKDEDNDWLELINDAYGMPFVLGYTNDGKGYIPFSLEYAYNTAEYFELTGKKKDTSVKAATFFAPGSYESNTSRFARGTGEAIIQKFKQMLQLVGNGYKTAYCEACKKEVEWTPLIAEQANNKNLGTGHYYLAEDLPAGDYAQNQRSVKAGEILCLDLNGHKMEAQSRNFYLEGSGATVNLMDSVGGGEVISYPGGNNVGGGLVYIGAGTNFNVYGGTLKFIRKEFDGNETGNGAIAAVGGTMRIYGGTLIGGELMKSRYYSPSSTTNGCGGTLYITGGKLYVYGGKIIAGKAADGARGDCIYMSNTSGRIYLSGDAEIDEIYIESLGGSILTVSGEFTGRAAVNINPEMNTITLNKDMGNSSSAKFGLENIYCTSHSQWRIGVSGTQLRAMKYSDKEVAAVSTPDGVTTYTSMNAAVAAYKEGHIVLLKDTAENVSFAADAYLDLNGCNITGAVTVADGKTLYCMDNLTDDYTVADGKYGKLSSVTGNVTGVPADADCAIDGYLMVEEAEGLSVHRINLRLSAMTLRPETVGVYYKSSFAADEKVAELVDVFGVALSLKGEPNAENLMKDCARTWFTDFQPGKTAKAKDANSSLLTGIMRTDLETEDNKSRAEMPVYGRTYIRLKDGTYIFGESAERSLRQQLELVSRMWGDSSFKQEQKDAVIAMYKLYEPLMSQWNIPKIIHAANPAEES